MKYYVIKTTRNGVEYKKNKCIDGWSKNKHDCWKFSLSGAEKIASRLNSRLKDYKTIHYNFIEATEGEN